MNLGFYSIIYEDSSLLGYYAMWVGKYLPKFQRALYFHFQGCPRRLSFMEPVILLYKDISKSSLLTVGSRTPFCHYLLQYSYLLNQSSEFCGHSPLYCISVGVYTCVF